MPEPDGISPALPQFAGLISILPITSNTIAETVEIVQCRQDLPSASDKLRAGENPFARYFLRNRNSGPLVRILSSVSLRWRACALLETPYLDLEFWSDHVGYYNWCFSRYPISCERFHFFSWSDAFDELNNTGQPQDEGTRLTFLKDMFMLAAPWPEIQYQFSKRFRSEVDYRGYCVVRPMASYVVGRTAIHFDNRPYHELPKNVREDLLEQEYGGTPYLLAKGDCRVNILGTSLSIKTTEFIQQDPNVGPCATASLWVATRTLAQRFNLNKYDYTTITRQAVGAGNREAGLTLVVDASGGLYPSEIEVAIRQTGAHPLTFNRKQALSQKAQSFLLQQELYGFVESGIPVIALVNQDKYCSGEGHAVVAIGHNLPQYDAVKKDYMQPVSSFGLDGLEDLSDKHFLVSSFIPIYYAHDDSYGPFNRLSFPASVAMTKSVELKQQRQSKWLPMLFQKSSKLAEPAEIKDFGSPEPERAAELAPVIYVGKGQAKRQRYLSQIIVPVPATVRVGSYAPLVEVLQLFDVSYLHLLEEDEAVIWRSFLAEATEFKKSTYEREYHPEFIKWYCNLLLPKYVWVYEFTILKRDDFSSAFTPGQNRYIHGEFLYDPTAPPHELHRLTARFMNWGEDYRGDKDHYPLLIDDDKGWCVYECFNLDSPNV